ncbi:MAG: PLP-dependent aminotransferase family protein [Synergistetes bacterium]|nr:PLP-dependent aminotransferase family protein [Synergistota bacterium]MCX8127667.1 PLP-dependent aminotransferase family protein [Synergistota bacterium]MDW8191418.1 PLP-dependent aminotransferase family protein [Synergistota bacterium]
MDWENRFTSLARDRIKPSGIEKMLKLMRSPGTISLAAGEPYPKLYPTEEFKKAIAEVIEDQGPHSLRYTIAGGLPELKTFTINWFKDWGIINKNLTEENILFTLGSQQALEILGQTFIEKGDVIAVEAPTYAEAMLIFKKYQARLLSIPMDENGMVVEDLEDKLKKEKIKFVYTITNFHNPAGVTLSWERREKLVELAKKYDFFIVEDDPYHFMSYEGEALPSITKIDVERVVSLGSFSKVMVPGLRIGWIIGPKEVIEKTTLVKYSMELCPPMILQNALYKILIKKDLKEHVNKLRSAYKEKRDALAKGLNEHLKPLGTEYTIPKGGFFFWIKLPKGIDSEELTLKAVQEYKVGIVPGTGFFVEPENGKSYARLAFSLLEPDQLIEGALRLGKALSSLL